MLNVIINWLKIPFQATLLNEPIDCSRELSAIPNNIVTSSDETLSYYTNDKYDGITHDTKDQFFNQSLYMYLYNLDDVKRAGMTQWIYWNLHGGKTLTNGISWDHDTLTFDNSNTSIKTIAALNLLLLNPVYRSSLAEKYEELMINLIDNDYCLNRMRTNLFNQKNIPVSIKNTDTYMGSGCSPDAAVVFLATLKIMDKLLGIPSAKKLYTEFYHKYGYNIKAKITSNKSEVIISLFILNTLTDDTLYNNLITKKLGTNIDTNFGNYLYDVLTTGEDFN